MKLARVMTDTGIWLALITDMGAQLLARESTEPGADALRSWLAAGRPTHVHDEVPVDSVSLLAPVRAPQKIIAVGLNYKSHAVELGHELPNAPMLFNKSPGAIIGPNTPISFATKDSDSVDYEAELAVIIGVRTRNVSSNDALRNVLGYTACNDVSARDAQRTDGQFFRAKSFDTFCPLGPWIVTADELDDPTSLRVRSRVNGEARQDATTADLIFSVAELISYASRFFTLEPGDVISTGTPGGVGSGRVPPSYLSNGDIVEIEIDRIGTLRNPVSTS